MANLMLGYRNQVPGAVLTASSAAAGLGPANLQDDDGSASMAWQTTGTGATLQIDAGTEAATWRAFLLARTNLTTAATVRWRVGPAEALVEAPYSVAAGFGGATAASLSAGGFSFTRASTATLLDPATGFFTSFAAGQPRSNANGLLFEGAATNLFGWNNSGTTGQSTGNSIAQQGGAAGPGAVTTQCTYNGPDSNIYFIGQGGLTSGQAYVASWLVFIPSSATLTSLTLAWEGSATNGVSVNANLAIRDRFQLVWCRAQINAASSAAVMRIGGAPAGTQIFVCAKQIEAGLQPSSFIPTSGGATASRAADTMALTAGIAAACTSGSYTLSVLAGWIIAPSVGYSFDVFLVKGGQALTAMARFSDSANGLAFNGSGIQSANRSQTYFPVPYSRIVVSVSPGGLGFAAFNGTAQSAAGLPSAQLPDTLAFGGGPNAAVFLSEVRLYPARLSQAQIQALANNGATVTGAAAFDSGTVPAGVAAGFGQSLVIAAIEAAGRVAQLDVSDPGNPDGFLNIPLAYAGPVLQPLRNYDYSSAEGQTEQSTKKVSRSGGVTKRTDWIKRVFELSLSGIRAVEKPQFLALDRFGRQGGNVLLVPDPASATRAQEAIFGEFEPQGNIGYPLQTPEARSYRATVTERL